MKVYGQRPSGDPFTTVFNTFINKMTSNLLSKHLKLKNKSAVSGDDYIGFFRTLQDALLFKANIKHMYAQKKT